MGLIGKGRPGLPDVVPAALGPFARPRGAALVKREMVAAGQAMVAFIEDGDAEAARVMQAAMYGLARLRRARAGVPVGSDADRAGGGVDMHQGG